jgi:hypothetical protein
MSALLAQVTASLFLTFLYRREVGLSLDDPA